MPRATIIHNPTAGDGRPSAGEIRELIQRQGYDAVYATTADDLDQLLQDPGDLVVVAGGDGTVGQVAARVLGRDLPLAILPVGTANNLASSIGIRGSVDRLVAAWRHATARRLDLGTVRGPWGVQPFIESMGLGLFPHAIPVLSALKRAGETPMTRQDQLRQDRDALRRLLDEIAPRPVQVRLDDEELDEPFLLVEVMNAPRLGPGLRLAPDADPGDGSLDVVLARPNDRRRLARWLGGDPDEGPPLQVRRARRIRIRWEGDPLHIDGDTWAAEGSPFRSVRTVPVPEPVDLEVGLHPGGVAVLVGA